MFSIFQTLSSQAVTPDISCYLLPEAQPCVVYVFVLFSPSMLLLRPCCFFLVAWLIDNISLSI